MWFAAASLTESAELPTATCSKAALLLFGSGSGGALTAGEAWVEDCCSSSACSGMALTLLLWAGEPFPRLPCGGPALNEKSGSFMDSEVVAEAIWDKLLLPGVSLPPSSC